MKVDILDSEVFASLLPHEIQSYLAVNLWREIRREERVVSIWEYDTATDERYHVWLPLDAGLADYGIAVARLVKTLALAEGRSQLQVLEDLGTVAIGDVIRGATWDELDRTSSSIVLSDGALLIRRLYDMNRAAAWSTVEKRPVFPYRSPSRVSEYLHRLRLGQTELGSYLVKIISPIQTPVPDPRVPLPGMPATDAVPFERQVVVNLVKGLEALRNTASDTYKRGRFYFEPFQEVVDQGVSANLCEAVVQGEEEVTRYQPLEVSVSWSYLLRAPSSPTVTTVSFTQEILPQIARGARAFRERNPELVSLVGFVTTLSRPLKHEQGSIRLMSRVGGAMRGVRMNLTRSDYHTAVQAHDNDLQVECEGQLTQQGNFYVLEDPTHFRIVSRGEQTTAEQLTYLRD